MAAALAVRRRLGINILDPLCVFDIAEKLEIEVRFVDTPSIDAVYSKQPKPTIFLSSGRPLVRQTFSCAHELGHHQFNHGIRLEYFLDATKSTDPEEFLADCFAGLLLMPQTAVKHAFIQRGWSIQSASPEQFYTIANNFGVGYTTLIHHTRGSLGLLDHQKAESLLKSRLPEIRRKLVNGPCQPNLHIVDPFWRGRPIDIQVGDLILLPSDTLESGAYIRQLNETPNGCLFEAIKKGAGQVSNGGLGWSSFVRVSEKEYVGRSLFRHLEEPADD
jgi:Zn-dependent peptidase ImmA (M78 family)